MTNVFKNRSGYGVGMRWRKGPYRALVDQVKFALDATLAEPAGFVPYNSLFISANPTAADTLVIGSDTYEFRGNAGEMSDDTYIAVRIAGSAELTLNNLVLAINGQGSATTSGLGVKQNGGGANAHVFNGTESVLAEKYSTTHLKIYAADSVGGDKVEGLTGSLACSASLATTKTWDFSDLDVTGLANTAQSSFAVIPVTTAMIANGFTTVKFPFTVTGFVFSALNATGAPVAGQAADTIAITSGVIKITLSGGFDDGDVISILAWSE